MGRQKTKVYELRDHREFAHDFLAFLGPHYSMHLEGELPHFVDSKGKPKQDMVGHVAGQLGAGDVTLKAVIQAADQLARSSVRRAYGVDIKAGSQGSVETEAFSSFGAIKKSLRSKEVKDRLLGLLKKHGTIRE